MTAYAGEPTGAALLVRGVCRTLEQLGYVSLVEFPLANGRRADILALGKTGDLVIVEIKSSVADFRADRKWSAYRDFSDRLYFAVPNDFPRPLIPDECGLMVADSFSAAVFRDGSTTRLDAGRRRALTMRFARIAATRLRRLLDPEAGRVGVM
ncbi:MAG: MmcB family DNA repair protein [Alphaproteobacteria bacterium]|nr:MmcB family DNA repair protein [Alphaproteobacteria bacterium]